MAKRKSSDGEGLNLDSLMDALTNVVAVLILVLLLVNADATNKIVKFYEDLEPATPEEVQASKDIIAKLLQQKKDTEDIFNKKPPTPEEIEAAKLRLIKLDADIKLKDAELKSITELRQELVVAETNRDKEKELVVALQKEIETMKSQLDNTKIEEPKDTVLQDIKIPEVKTIPDDAETFFVYVRGNKLALFDHVGIEDEIEKEWTAKKRTFAVDKKKIKVGDAKRQKEITIDVHDHLKTKEFLDGVVKNLKSNTSNINVRLDLAPWSDVPWVTLSTTNAQGIDVTELDKPQNAFADALRKVGNVKNGVIYFRLDDNPQRAKESFLTYQKAREFVEKKFSRIPIGWGIIVNDRDKQRWEHETHIKLDRELFTVQPMGTPPPPAKKTPTPPQGPTPPPMKLKLG